MKKLFFITLILCLQSFPSLSKEVKGKGLYCTDTKADAFVAIYFYENSYDKWVRELIDYNKDKKFNSFLHLKKNETKYKLFTDSVTLFWNKVEFVHWTIDRYELIMKTFKRGELQQNQYRCEVYNSRELLLDKIELEDLKYNNNREGKLNKRKL